MMKNILGEPLMESVQIEKLHAITGQHFPGLVNALTVRYQVEGIEQLAYAEVQLPENASAHYGYVQMRRVLLRAVIHQPNRFLAVPLMWVEDKEAETPEVWACLDAVNCEPPSGQKHHWETEAPIQPRKTDLPESAFMPVYDDVRTLPELAHTLYYLRRVDIYDDASYAGDVSAWCKNTKSDVSFPVALALVQSIMELLDSEAKRPDTRPGGGYAPEDPYPSSN